MSAAQRTSSQSLDQKYQRMRDILGSLRRVAVAFSAGVDSTLVLKVAVDVLGPENVVALTGRSASLAQAELQQAGELAAACGVEHVFIDTKEFDQPDYLANPPDRCYYCKTELYGQMTAFVAERGLAALVDGLNAEDYHDWRPGIRAATELGVRAPCAEAGLTKQDIRELSRRLGLPTFDKPAMPCLSSRVEIGEAITPEKLGMIERGEAFLRSLGLGDVRVRHHGKLARLEIPAERISEFMRPEMRAKIDAALRRIGYTWVAMDLRGFRSGSMNEPLQLKQPTDD